MFDPSHPPIKRPTRSSSSAVIKFVEPKCKIAAYQKSDIIRCIRFWNVVADELNLRMNALNDFKQAMVEYNKTALSNYRTVKIPTLLSMSALNAISVVVLPSLSRVVVLYSETSIKPTPITRTPSSKRTLSRVPKRKSDISDFFFCYATRK